MNRMKKIVTKKEIKKINLMMEELNLFACDYNLENNCNYSLGHLLGFDAVGNPGANGLDTIIILADTAKYQNYGEGEFALFLLEKIFSSSKIEELINEVSNNRHLYLKTLYPF